MNVLLRPRWVILFVVALVLAIGFTSLGMWQWTRLAERRADNALVADRLDRDPIGVDEAFAGVAASLDVAAQEFTRVRASGSYLPDEVILVRNETNLGEAGFHVIAPLALNDQAVLVNVGWVPLTVDRGAAADLLTVDSVTIEGLLRATELRPSFGREEPDGQLEVVNLIDIDRIQFQSSLPLLPFWLQLTGPDDPTSLPIPVPVPVLDEGSHFSYMVQWFSFAAIVVGGVIALARREVRRGSGVVHDHPVNG